MISTLTQNLTGKAGISWAPFDKLTAARLFLNQELKEITNFETLELLPRGILMAQIGDVGSELLVLGGFDLSQEDKRFLFQTLAADLLDQTNPGICYSYFLH